MQLGLGPVFWFEWLRAARRWQMFAVRTGFLVLLFGLILWIPDWHHTDRYLAPTRFWPRINDTIFTIIIWTLLALVLAAAPAGMAGAICKDKTSGGLIHLFGTDLSDFEIVFGKFAAHFWPVLGLLLSIVPILAVLSVQGGILPDFVLGAFLVLLSTALLVCSFALFLSMLGRKTHEVLTLVYLLLFLAAGGLIFAESLVGAGTFYYLNPFVMAAANRSTVATVTLWEQSLFFFVCVLLFLSLMAATWLLMRPVGLKQASAGGLPTKSRSSRAWGAHHLLDDSPVLWLECNRSRRGRWIWRVFWLVTGIQFLVSVLVPWPTRTFEQFVVFSWSTTMAVGLFLLAIDAVTSLSEDRSRGSLDILLTTPLTTPEIINGKWWACYRRVILLLIAPTSAYWFMMATSQWPGAQHHPIEGTLCFLLCVLVHTALVVSLGLLLAVRISSTTKAVVTTVVLLVLLNSGWIVLVLAIGIGNSDLYWLCGSQWFSFAFSMVVGVDEHTYKDAAAVVIWTGVYLVVAGLLYFGVRRSFDRCLGRMFDRAKRRRVVRDPSCPENHRGTETQGKLG